MKIKSVQWSPVEKTLDSRTSSLIHCWFPLCALQYKSYTSCHGSVQFSSHSSVQYWSKNSPITVKFPPSEKQKSSKIAHHCPTKPKLSVAVARPVGHKKNPTRSVELGILTGWNQSWILQSSPSCQESLLFIMFQPSNTHKTESYTGQTAVLLPRFCLSAALRI